MSEDGFKVVDKRRFSDSGESKAGDHSEKRDDAYAAPSFEQSTDHVSDTFSGNDSSVDFPSFIMGLATQTMMMLGEIPHPDTNELMINIEAAQQTIDILALLEQKTKGNLSKDEERLLEDLLANLRLAYVSKVRGK